jgi:UPF0271 protein
MKTQPAIDINCDLGEGEPLVRTRALMRWITSANIACGGHAGTARSMTVCVRAAREAGVHVGAHPGPWSRADRGRGDVTIAPADLTLLLLHQVGALTVIAARERVPLHHIKLHGALYHAIEADSVLSRAYVECVATHWPGVIIYALAGGRVAKAARRANTRYFAESFADRAYRSDGSLVPRTDPRAVVHDVDAVASRVNHLVRHRRMAAIDGTVFFLRADTLCIHSDTPGALRIARTVAQSASRQGS